VRSTSHGLRRGAAERGRRRPRWRLGLIAAVSCLVCGLVAWSAPALGDSPFSWSLPVAIDSPNTLNAVSCPSVSLCVAVDDAGSVVTTTNPVSGPWTATLVEPSSLFNVDSVSCPSTSLCVAADQSGRILTSTNPTGGAAAWTLTPVTGTIGFNGVSCPSTSLCVAITEEGNVATSTNPAAANPTWTITSLSGGKILNEISCASQSLCVATDLSGDVLTSTNPTGGTAAWTFTNLEKTGLYGISCPSTTFCAAGDQLGNVLTATDPTGGAAAWTSATVDASRDVYSLSCPSTTLCVGTDNQGGVVTSTNPAAGAAAWTATQVAANNDFLYGVSCASLSLCVVTDQNGNAIIGTSSAPTHTLSVTLAGTGSGAVAGDQPPKIACPGTCSQQYPSGTVVTLTETPSAGSTFAGWSGGGCPATNTTCTVTLGADTPVTATFNASGGGSPPVPAISVKLTTTVYGDGIGSVHDNYGHTCSKSSAGAAPCPPVYYPYGTTVVLGGSASGTATFNGFLGGGCPSFATTCTIMMNGDQTVNAYVYKLQEVRVGIGGTGGGAVTGTPSIGGCGKPLGLGGAVCIHYFPWGTAVTLHAAPDPGSEFDGWSGGCHGTGDCYLNTAFGTQAVGATFSPAAFHVNGIEITQGVQTPELPTRTSAADTTVSYSGVSMPWSATPVKVQLVEGHMTVIRVYANTGASFNGSLPGMRLSAYRNGQLLAPGPVTGSQPPTVSAIPVGPVGQVKPAQRFSQTGAYTFTLPLDWTRGDVQFVADANPTPGLFPNDCPDDSCRERGIVLNNIHFTPVHTTTIDPIAFLAGTHEPQGYPGYDPAWNKVKAVLPFPIQVNPYVQVTGVTSTLTTCDGQTQGANQSNAAFAQQVYRKQANDLTQVAADWAAANDIRIGYPFGIVPAGVPNNCPNTFPFTGGNTTSIPGGPSVASDDRPLTALAHELSHGVGRVHAGVECGSGADPTTDGTVATLTGNTTNGSLQITNLSSVTGLAASQPISGPGVQAGATIQSITPPSAVTMNLPANKTNTGATYTFTNDDALTGNQGGETWPQLVGGTNFLGGSYQPTFTASDGTQEDGAIDGIGLAGIDSQLSSKYVFRSPYSIIYNKTLPAPLGPGAEIFDLMSYCAGINDANAWISVLNWNRDVTYAQGPAVGTAGRVGFWARDTGGPVFRTSPPATTNAARSLAVTDVYDIATGGSLLTHVEPDASAPTPVQPGSTYSLLARDASGHVVATAGAVSLLVHGDWTTPVILIFGKIAARGVREIDVLHDGIVVGRIDASAHAPTVAITSPGRGARIGGPRGAVVRWRSHDSDGDRLTAMVRYSPDGGRTWRSIYSGPDTGSVKLPSYLLSASREARVRIYTSDGFYTAIATSPRFVAIGAPPLVTITTPTGAARVAAGAALVLAGSAYDDTGGRLTGRALTWRAGRRVIAAGSQAAVVDLPAGHHRITLTARDRHGRTASASVWVTITPSPPVLKLLHTPKRISSKARSLRLSLATLAPAKVAIGRTHTLVGRSPRTLRVAIRPGRTPLTIVLTLRSGPYVSRAAIAVVR
jgi:Divergent InlB B-repeat domain